MKLALNGATIMRSSLADDVEIAADGGYDALEIWAGKLPAYLQLHPLETLRERMRSRGIMPWCINSIEDITGLAATGRREVLARTEELAAIARAIGAPSIVVVPGTDPADTVRSERIADAADILGAMSDVAADVSLAFEFLGKPGCSVPTLDMAIDIVEQADRPNVGLVIDTFHFHAGGSRLKDIDHVRLDKLFVVHLNGCEDRPRDKLTDEHRLYPGEGVLPSIEILTALRQRGWDGTVSIEIFRPEYWAADARKVARTAHDKAACLLEKAGFVPRA